MKYNFIRRCIVKKVSRKDIARICNTSVSTVNRALTNTGYVSDIKKELIFSTAMELGYIKDIENNHKKDKKIIAYICMDLENSFNRQMYKGMIMEGKSLGYDVVLSSDIESVYYNRENYAGIIFPNESSVNKYLDISETKEDLKKVCAGYGDGIYIREPIHIVEVDMYNVTQLALDYLYKNGHKKIVLIMPFEDYKNHARAKAFINWNIEKGVKNPQKNIINMSSKDFFETGLLSAKILKERINEFTAVIGFNDEVSLGIIKGLKDLNIDIPKEISIIGIDGIESRKYISPKLTSVEVFPEEQGRKCVSTIISIIENRKIKYINHMKYKIIEAESVLNINRRKNG
jgi:LacI family transcriptional regulator